MHEAIILLPILYGLSLPQFQNNFEALANRELRTGIGPKRKRRPIREKNRTEIIRSVINLFFTVYHEGDEIPDFEKSDM
jgi:hypothetical protein